MNTASTKLATLTQAQVATWVDQARTQTQAGRLPDYIPLLAQAHPEWVAVQIHPIAGLPCSVGVVAQPFALMSVVKPFLLLFLLHHLGSKAVFSRVGLQPSEQSFHSLTQLQIDRGFPRNPMINSGAIALAALLPGHDGATRCEALRQWLNQQSGSQLQLDTAMLASVRSLNNEANRALANFLAKAGYLDAIDSTLDTYNHICCLSGTVADLAQLGLLLASPALLTSAHQRLVNTLMLTCGLYEASAQFAVRIGLPIKSGVSGALLAIVPGEGAIACYSPTLDSAGNSVAGLWLLEHLARELNLSLFAP